MDGPVTTAMHRKYGAQALYNMQTYMPQVPWTAFLLLVAGHAATGQPSFGPIRRPAGKAQCRLTDLFVHPLLVSQGMQAECMLSG